MKRLIGIWAALSFGVMPLVAAAPPSKAAGVKQFRVPSHHRDDEIDLTVWYPTASDGPAELLGETVFFEGTPAVRDAEVIDELYPVILLSHGAGLAGRAEAMSWIASPLADQGFVVVAPTHAGNTGPDRSAAETMKLWLRPTDLSSALDALVTDTDFASNIDMDRIGVLGLSMGGNTALLLAGAKLSPDLWVRYCDTDALNPSLCEWVRHSGVDLHTMDTRDVGLDYSDDRIKFAMAIDPAPSDIFVQESFAQITIPVALVNLGSGTRPRTIDAAPVAGAIPAATYQVLAPASHFSMFGLCKAAASEIATEEGIEDPICDDGGAVSRSYIHGQLIETVAARFSAELGQRH